MSTEGKEILDNLGLKADGIDSSPITYGLNEAARYTRDELSVILAMLNQPMPVIGKAGALMLVRVIEKTERMIAEA